MAKTAYVTLTASTDVQLSVGPGVNSVEVVNRDGTAEIFYSIDDAGTGVAVGAANAAGAYCLPASVSSSGDIPVNPYKTVVVTCYSTGTPKVAVLGRTR